MDRMLKLTGDSKGRDVEVEVALEDVWEQISNDDYAAEFAERARSEPVKHAVTLHAPEELWDTGDDAEDEMFAALGPWDRAELLKAIRNDDGRRVVDLLRRCVTA
jgi:hypothetical protein